MKIRIRHFIVLLLLAALPVGSLAAEENTPPAPVAIAVQHGNSSAESVPAASGAKINSKPATAPENSATPTPTPTPVRTGGVGSLMSVFGGLVFILAIIFALAWFVKRVGQGGVLANNTLKIAAALPLGTRERLVLVDVGGKQLLLGMTPHTINTLHVFDEPITDPAASREMSEFALKLRGLLNAGGAAKKHPGKRGSE